jgi:hypothetical protein
MVVIDRTVAQEDLMRIDLNEAEARALQEVLSEKVVELDKEINRTDSLRFKDELRNLDRKLERVLGELSSGLSRGAGDDIPVMP